MIASDIDFNLHLECALSSKTVNQLSTIINSYAVKIYAVVA